MKFSSKFTLAAIKKSAKSLCGGKNTPPPFVKLPTLGMCVYMYMCLWVGVNMCWCVCAYMCLCIRACLHVCVCVRMCTCMCAYMCVCVCVCVLPYEAYHHGKFYMQILQGSECHEVEHLQMPSKDFSIEDTGECFCINNSYMYKSCTCIRARLYTACTEQTIMQSHCERTRIQ